MSRERNLQNLKTEKEGILVLKKLVPKFYVPNTEERKRLYEILDIDYSKYSRSVDGIIINTESFDQIKSSADVQLVEIKTTKAKNVTELPYGAFFGITKNEEDLFKARENFRLCIVHTTYEKYILLNYSEYEKLIQNKRVQFQVNFKTKANSTS